MKNILLTSDFVSFFQNIEWAKYKTARWTFNKKIQGNLATYYDLFNYFEFIENIFPWICPLKIILPESPNLKPDSWSYGSDFTVWKKQMLQKYAGHKWYTDYESDVMYIKFDYYYLSNTKDKPSLIFHKEKFDFGIYICIWEYENYSKLEFYFETKGEPFYELPWGNIYPEFSLPKNYVIHNRLLLKDSFEKLYQDGFKLECMNFESKANPTWSINEYGFTDKIQ